MSQPSRAMTGSSKAGRQGMAKKKLVFGKRRRRGMSTNEWELACHQSSVATTSQPRRENEKQDRGLIEGRGDPPVIYERLDLITLI